MNNNLTITKEMTPMPLAGETEVRQRRTRDSRLGVTDYPMDGRSQIGRPAHFLEMAIQNSPMPKKPPCRRQGTLLTVSGNCPIHAEPVQFLQKTPMPHVSTKGSGLGDAEGERRGNTPNPPYLHYIAVPPATQENFEIISQVFSAPVLCQNGSFQTPRSRHFYPTEFAQIWKPTYCSEFRWTPAQTPAILAPIEKDACRTWKL